MGKADRILAANRAGIRASIGIGDAPRPTIPITPDAPAEPDEQRERNVVWIGVKKIDADPGQPRREFDPEKLAALAASLKANGQLQECRVVAAGGGRYRLISGERRWRAAQLAGLPRLRCQVVAPPEIGRLLAEQIIENVQREDLAPMDLARSLARLRDDHGLSQSAIAEHVGLTQSAVSKSLELLGLPAPVRRLVEEERLAPSTAREVAKADGARAQVRLANEAAREGLTRDQVAARARGLFPGNNPPPTRAPEPAPPGGVIPGEYPPDVDEGEPLGMLASGPGMRMIEVEPGVTLRFARADGKPVTMFMMRDWAARVLSQLNRAIAADPKPRGKLAGKERKP